MQKNRIKLQLNTILILMGLLSIQLSFSQQETLTRMFWNNYSVINPANSGFEKRQNYSAQYQYRQYSKLVFVRSTWAVADVFIKPLNSGLGLSYFYNNADPFVFNKARLNYNYQFTIRDKHIFSLGYAIGFDRYQAYQNFTNDFDPDYVATINIGLLYKFKNLKFGFSITNLNEPIFEQSSTYWDFQFPEYRHFFILAAYRIEIFKNWELIPSIYYADDNRFGEIFDMNTRVFFKKKYFLGMSYNDNSSFGIQSGIELWEKLMISYAYENRDYEIGYQFGHEVSLTFSIDRED